MLIISGLIVLASAGWDGSALAQQDLGDVFGNVGSTALETSPEDELAADLQPDEGTLTGQVINAETGVPVSNATVILIWPDPADGSEARQEVHLTGSGGEFRFPRVPAGTYRLNFIKSGYRVAELKSFKVIAGQVNVADFPLPPKTAATAGDVMNLEAFVVEAAIVGDMMQGLELRMDSDAMVDVMGAEDLSKYAASDVADALKRVAGVNVVEGRFAVIRGLDDRYSSTLFNQAPIPSSDPLRQSVQLDLFPSDIVSGIVVAKTFEAPTPGNSGAGSIDINTMSYPDDFTLRLSGGSGFNENALQEFLLYQPRSFAGVQATGEDIVESDVNVSLGGKTSLWNRELRYKAVFAREVDFVSGLGYIEGLEPRPAFTRRRGSRVQVRETGDLALGLLTLSDGRFDLVQSEKSEQYTYYGALGIDLDEGGKHRVDLTAFHTSKNIEDVQSRTNGYIPGFDYDYFRGTFDNSPYISRFANNLYFRSQDFRFLQDWNAVSTVNSPLNRYRSEPNRPELGPLSYAPIELSRAITQDRQLTVFQLNGEDDLEDLLEGLSFKWVANYARSQQEETALAARYWWEALDAAAGADEVSFCGLPRSFPAQPYDFPTAPGPGATECPTSNAEGNWRTIGRDLTSIANRIDENQGFGRGDLTYEFPIGSKVEAKAGTGFWYENATRDLTFSEYLLSNPIPGSPGVVNGSYVTGDTPVELATNTFQAFDLAGVRADPAESKFSREIAAGYFDLKMTFLDDLDIIGGVRLEQIKIIADNRPFTGACLPRGSGIAEPDPTKTGNCPDPTALPAIFPGRYVYLDRQDNPQNPYFREDRSYLVDGIFHDQLLNIDLAIPQTPYPPGPGCDGPEDCLFYDVLNRDMVLSGLRGEIDELKVLPMASLAYRPVEGITLRAAYSETVSRPSFRELAYYASIVPGIPDRILGNPQLDLSEVQSVDTRFEYFWGDVGDLFAVGFFYKSIENPIELIVLKDPSIRGQPLLEGPFRVYRNNENSAQLLGAEIEGRITLDIVEKTGADLPFLAFFSLGGNFTYIDAKVARSAFEIQQPARYFEATEEDIENGNVRFTQLSSNRRLFNQPEWTANANITFDQPNWGTTATLSVFAISDILNAAGFAETDGGGQPEAYTLDEFTDSYYQLDLVFGQNFEIPRTPGIFTLRASLKNLTDTVRGFIYDKKATSQVYRERQFTVGRDYSFALQYQVTF